MKDNNINISISSGTIIKTAFFIALFAILYYAREVVVALLVAVVLASAVEIPVKFLSKFKIPRWLSVPLIFILLIASVASAAFLFIPPMADDIAKFIASLPQLLNSVQIFGKDMGFKDLSTSMMDLAKTISKGQILTVIKDMIFGSSSFFTTTSFVLSSILNVILTFVLSFYLSLQDGGVKKFLRLVFPKVYESYIEDLWDRSQRKISLWLQGQFLLSFLVALLVYIPNLILGLPYAALIAVLAFFGELVPMVGLTLAMVPAFFVAWVHGGTSLLWIVVIIYVIISQFESHVLYPSVMNKLVGVPAVVVIISLVIGAKLAGLWGVLLAVPMASVIMEIVADVEKRKAHAG